MPRHETSWSRRNLKEDTESSRSKMDRLRPWPWSQARTLRRFSHFGAMIYGVLNSIPIEDHLVWMEFADDWHPPIAVCCAFLEHWTQRYFYLLDIEERTIVEKLRNSGLSKFLTRGKLGLLKSETRYEYTRNRSSGEIIRWEDAFID